MKIFNCFLFYNFFFKYKEIPKNLTVFYFIVKKILNLFSLFYKNKNENQLGKLVENNFVRNSAAHLEIFLTEYDTMCYCLL